MLTKQAQRIAERRQAVHERIAKEHGELVSVLRELLAEIHPPHATHRPHERVQRGLDLLAEIDGER